MISRKVKLSNGKKFTVQAATYHEVVEHVLAYMKKHEIKRAFIKTPDRVDSITYIEGFYHYKHPNYKFNSTGLLLSKHVDHVFNSIR